MSTPESRGPAMIAAESGDMRREFADEPVRDAEAVEWVPEFEGQRPPFREGNEAAVTHGARSQRKVEELARQIDADLLTRAPWVAEYPEALKAYGRAESVARMLFNDIAKVGVYGSKGEFRASILARWATAENTAARHREALGLTPKSEAQVARDRAVAASASVDVVAELVRQGQATRAQRQPEGAVLVASDPPAPHDLPALDPEAVTEHDREDTP